MSKRIQLLAMLLLTAPGLADVAIAEDLKLIYAESPFGFITYQTAGGGPSGGKTPYSHYADDMHDLGVHWVRATGRRTAFMWGRIQRSSDANYDWAMADKAIGDLQDEKIMALGQFLTVVHWARKDARALRPNNPPFQRRGRSWGDISPQYHDHYARYIQAVVERYDGDGIDDMPGLRYPIKHWMIENEPEVRNIFWSDTPENLAHLCFLTYRAMRKADPQAKLVIPGPGPGGVMEYLKAGEPVPKLFSDKARRWFRHSGSPDQDGFFVRLLRQLKVDMKDASPENLIIDFHLYGDWYDYLGYKYFVEIINRRLKEFGYGKRPIWVTEAGTFSGYNSGMNRPRTDILAAQKGSLPHQSEAEQARSLVQRFVYGAALGIEKQFWFTVKAGANDQGSYFNLTGIIRLDDRKKLAYYSLKLLAEKSRAVQWAKVTQLNRGTPGTFVFRLPKQKDGSLYVAWADPRDENDMPVKVKQPLEIELTNLSGTKLTITSAVANSKTGAGVKDYQTAFKTRSVPIKDGKARIHVGRNPVYLEDGPS